jgi:HSP20 family protein
MATLHPVPKPKGTGLRPAVPIPEDRMFLREIVLPQLRTDDRVDPSWSPPVDFVEDRKKYTLFMDVPGVNKEDLHVNLKDGILYVHGKRVHEKEVRDEAATRYSLERHCGNFMRHFHLHSNIQPDKMRADYKNGILKVTVPKNQKYSTKSIPVTIR